jgi:hypothetical protein
MNTNEFAAPAVYPRKDLSRDDRVHLGSSTATYTPTAAFEWASAAVRNARAMLKGPITAVVWSYNDPCECFSLDLGDSNKEWFPITITLAGRSAYECDVQSACILCTDAIEALHLIGMVTRGLDANVEIGCYKYEENKELHSHDAAQNAFRAKMKKPGVLTV